MNKSRLLAQVAADAQCPGNAEKRFIPPFEGIRSTLVKIKYAELRVGHINAERTEEGTIAELIVAETAAGLSRAPPQ